ncbi:hypothetical protein OEB94_21450, partial [Streptomyces sp. ICN988]|nr:hypothetical protein [Streptomyces sp. ICN988]
MTDQPHQPYGQQPYEGHDAQAWPGQQPYQSYQGYGEQQPDPNAGQYTQQWQGQTWETQVQPPVSAEETAYLPPYAQPQPEPYPPQGYGQPQPQPQAYQSQAQPYAPQPQPQPYEPPAPAPAPSPASASPSP